MDWAGFISEAVTGSLSMIKKVTLIIFPLLIGVELAEETGILEKISKVFTPLLKHFKLSKEAGLPLIVAQISGLTYGAGVILKEVRDDKLQAQEIMILTIFLIICHGLIEDTLLLMAVGANGLVILVTRVMVAAVVSYFYAKYFVDKEEVNIEKAAELDC